MRWNRSTKPIIFMVVLVFLLVGGASAFLYVINRSADPEVEADIDAHFAAMEGLSQIEGEFADGPSVWYRNDSHGEVTSDATSERKNRKGHRKQRRTAEPPGDRTPYGQGSNPVVSSPTGIVMIADGTWLISRSTLNDARSNPSRYLGSTTAELAEEDGQPAGFKLKNIGKTSPLHSIGLRNRDILMAINGHPLTSIENVTLAVASFQNATKFRLDILRKQKKRSFYYKIVED